MNDPTHDWARDEHCKGCGCHHSDPEAMDPCPKPALLAKKSPIEQAREKGHPISHFPLNHPDHPFHRARRALDELVLCTPTGDVRNSITEANIHLMKAMEQCSL